MFRLRMMAAVYGLYRFVVGLFAMAAAYVLISNSMTIAFSFFPALFMFALLANGIASLILGVQALRFAAAEPNHAPLIARGILSKNYPVFLLTEAFGIIATALVFPLTADLVLLLGLSLVDLVIGSLLCNHPYLVDRPRDPEMDRFFRRIPAPEVNFLDARPEPNFF